MQMEIQTIPFKWKEKNYCEGGQTPFHLLLELGSYVDIQSNWSILRKWSHALSI